LALKKLVILMRFPDEKERSSLLKSNLSEKLELYYDSRLDKLSFFEQFEWAKPIDFNSDYQKSYEESFDELIALGHRELFEGESIASYLKGKDGYSLWYYIRFMVLYKYRTRRYDDLVFSKIKSIAEGKETIVYHQSSYLASILKEEGMESMRLQKATVASKKWQNTLLFLYFFISRLLIGFTQIPRLFQSWEKVLLVNALVRQKVVAKDGKTLLQGDHFTQYLQEEIGSEKSCMLISELFPPQLNATTLLDKKQVLLKPQYKRTIHMELILFLNLFNPFFYYRATLAVMSMRKKLQNLF
jgi:hypothetical protein